MSYTRFSGFSPRQVKELSELLQKKGIRFEVFVDMESFRELEDRSKQEHTLRGHFNFDPHHISFDVAEEDIEKIDEECAAHGFSHFDPTQNGEHQLESEDYLCPECDHCQMHTGLCPTHHLPLLSFSNWNAERRARDSTHGRRSIFIVAAVVVAIISAIFLLK